MSGTRHCLLVALCALSLAGPAVIPAEAAAKKKVARKSVTAAKNTTKAAAKKKPTPRARAGRRARSRSRTPVNFRRVAIAQPDLTGFPDMVPPVPDLGVRELYDSFLAGRVGRRLHYAIDIMRPEGSPMVACVDGIIEKLHTSSLGGIAIYLTDAARKHRFYYAHLSAYADGLAEGMPVMRGELIGYVGSTGNASATSPHLHFQVMRADASGNWWRDAGVVNPFPILLSLVKQGVQAATLPVIEATAVEPSALVPPVEVSEEIRLER